MRVIAPVPKQFEDSNGVPYANGKVTVYLHNSTSLARIYKEAEGGTLAPNPTILDSHGAWNAFVNGGTAYDYVVQDEHDNVIFSYSNVKAFDGGGTTYIAGNGISISEENEIAVKTDNSTIHVNSSGELEVIGGGVSVPLVRVGFRNGAWSKLYGDDGFIKANEFGQQALYLPEGGWWHIDATLAVKNNTAQDLLQHISLGWNWNFFIEEGVPWGSYAAAGFPSMMHQIDYTRTATNNRCFGFVVNKDGSHTNDWLSVGLNAYEDTLPDSVEWAVYMDIFKVRDA